LIASIFKDLTVALAVLPVILLPLLLFSGLFVNTDSIPVYFNWIKYISPMYYAFIGMMETEFSDTDLNNCDAAVRDCSGEAALKAFAIDNQLPIGVNIVFMCVIFVALVLAAYLVLLVITKRRYKR
jgi:ABC-type multidrug transport system permease subunit